MSLQRVSVGAPSFAVPAAWPELVKWVALVAMVADHVNKFVYHGALPGVYQFGRISMPLFGAVLAFNLARFNAITSGVFMRTLLRLCVFGALTTPVFVALVGWWPLNFMFTLALSTAVIWLAEAGVGYGIAAAVTLFILGGFFVEFWWPGVAFCIAVWWFCKRPSWKRALAPLLACCGLTAINGLANATVNGVGVLTMNADYWALASFPVMSALLWVDLDIPRSRYFFYVFYPSHLVLLWIWSRYS